MENKSTQINQTVLLDRKMIIEGVQYHEKTIERVLKEDGVEMSISSHLRSIGGDRVYMANQNFVNGKVQDETIETNLAVDEVADFLKDWGKNWHPECCRHPNLMIGEQSTGIWRTFVNKLDDFLTYIKSKLDGYLLFLN